MNQNNVFDNEIDVAQLVSEIRTAAAGDGDVDFDLLRDAAAQYSEISDLANRRLVECHGLLRRGLRSEAIQACERHDNVLTLIELLDFPERQQWCILLSQYRMAQPPELKIDLAADLNEAYAEEQTLDTLLRKQRLLALARAPLASRISVLRSIRRRDPTNPAWEEDVAQYEKVRLKQIASEIKGATAAGDADSVRELYEEITDTRWTVPPEEDLVARCRESHEHFLAQSAKQQLSVTEKELNAAYAELDVDATRAAKKTWDEYLPIANLPAEDPLMERVQPAMEWLSEQELIQEEEAQFATACSRFEAALYDFAASQNQLDRLHRSLTRFDREIPANLEQRYQQRLQAHDLAQRRRFRLYMAGTIGLLIIVAFIVYAIVSADLKEKRVGRAEARLDAVFAKGDYEGVINEWERINGDNPETASHPRVLKIKHKAEERLERIDNDQARAEEYISQAKELVPEGDITESKRADNLIDEADLLCREMLAELWSDSSGTDPPPWQRHVEELRRESDILRATIEETRDKKFLEAFEEVQKLYEELDEEVRYVEQQLRKDAPNGQDIIKAVEKAIDKADDVLRVLKQVKRKHRFSSLELDKQAEMLETDVVADKEDLIGLRRYWVLLGELVASVGDVEEYRKAAEECVREAPEYPLSAGLKRVLDDETLLWKGVLSWSSFLGDLDNIRELSPTEAQNQITRGENLLEEHGNIPLAKEYEGVEPFLRAISNRKQEDGTALLESLSRFRESPLISDVWMVMVRGGEGTDEGAVHYTRYYVDADSDPVEPTGIPGVYRVYYMSDKRGTEKLGYIREKEGDIVVYNEKAPQCELTKNMVDKLKDMQPSQWESTFRDLIRQFYDNKDLDPILKYRLLDRMLEVTCDGSVLMKAAFGEFSRQLRKEADSLDTGDDNLWLNPEDQRAMEVREGLLELLSGLPTPQEVDKVISKESERLTTLLQKRLHWIGILVSNKDGSWDCRPDNTRKNRGDLFVITQARASNDVSLHRIGAISEQGVRWDAPDDNALFRQGRAVFARAESTSN